jgi:hypothetical protein
MCSHLLGRMVCDRETPHDENAAGGHTYTPSDGSNVDDRHTEGGHG